MSSTSGRPSLHELTARRPLALELGCGPSKRNRSAVGVDVLDLPGVDIVGDALSALAALPDGSVDSIYSEHFLEHLDDPRRLVAEAARVLRPGGEFRAVVPHFSNPYFYSDPTHRAFYGLYTFGYWVEQTPFRRQVPQYEAPIPLTLVSATLTFQSSRPFYVRHAFKKAATFWVNWSRWTKEFYEENLTSWIGVYEVEYVLVKQPVW
ncbi:MAG: class I SAM-dependent methyltransferase [Mycobacteriaceae bacterium]